MQKWMGGAGGGATRDEGGGDYTVKCLSPCAI